MVVVMVYDPAQSRKKYLEMGRWGRAEEIRELMKVTWLQMTRCWLFEKSELGLRFYCFLLLSSVSTSLRNPHSLYWFSVS